MNLLCSLNSSQLRNKVSISYFTVQSLISCYFTIFWSAICYVSSSLIRLLSGLQVIKALLTVYENSLDKLIFNKSKCSLLVFNWSVCLFISALIEDTCSKVSDWRSLTFYLASMALNSIFYKILTNCLSRDYCICSRILFIASKVFLFSPNYWSWLSFLSTKDCRWQAASLAAASKWTILS
jgi:hypothetical protein